MFREEFAKFSVSLVAMIFCSFSALATDDTIDIDELNAQLDVAIHQTNAGNYDAATEILEQLWLETDYPSEGQFLTVNVMSSLALAKIYLHIGDDLAAGRAMAHAANVGRQLWQHNPTLLWTLGSCAGYAVSKDANYLNDSPDAQFHVFDALSMLVSVERVESKNEDIENLRRLSMIQLAYLDYRQKEMGQASAHMKDAVALDATGTPVGGGIDTDINRYLVEPFWALLQAKSGNIDGAVATLQERMAKQDWTPQQAVLLLGGHVSRGDYVKAQKVLDAMAKQPDEASGRFVSDIHSLRDASPEGWPDSLNIASERFAFDFRPNLSVDVYKRSEREFGARAECGLILQRLSGTD